MCCLGCEEDEYQITIDENLFGTWESSINDIFPTPYYQTLYYSLGDDVDFSNLEIETISFNGMTPTPPRYITFKFSSPNDYSISQQFGDSNTIDTISSGTFYNQNSGIIFNGNFKENYLNVNGDPIWSFNHGVSNPVEPENINFEINYNISNLDLNLSTISIISEYQFFVGVYPDGSGPGGLEVVLNNLTTENYCDNFPLFLDNRNYSKLN